jgi:hypothetical protein
MEEAPEEVQEYAVYAWVGLDEFGSGEYGLKQGIAPAGTIPMVSADLPKLDKYWQQAEAQAMIHGKRIYLIKMVCTEVIRATKHGI